jgi:hypothetical protein
VVGREVRYSLVVDAGLFRDGKKKESLRTEKKYGKKEKN